jgi:methionine-rich copper-binding protein CopC
MKRVKPGAAGQPVAILSLVTLALLLAFAIAPASALAHAQIATSSPPNGSTVAPGLTQIILNFTEDISPEQSSARLIGPDGSAVPGVASAVDRADRTRMTVITQPLQAGKYTIKWLAVTENDSGHTNGAINFAVAASNTVASSSDSSTTGVNRSSDTGTSPPTRGADPTWFVPLGVVAGALLILLAAVGILLMRARSARPPAGRNPN